MPIKRPPLSQSPAPFFIWFNSRGMPIVRLQNRGRGRCGPRPALISECAPAPVEHAYALRP